MEYLHQLSEKGRKIIFNFILQCFLYLKGTIIFSIHQPRYSIFKLFDSLFLIAAGRCVYHGPARDVLPFFSSVGFPCEEHENPADFILDILQGDQLPVLIDHSDRTELDKQENKIEFYLDKAYIKTEIYGSIQSQISEKNDLSKENKAEKIRFVTKSRLNDLFYLSQRTFRNSFRNPTLFISQISISIVMAILIGLIYLNIDRTTDAGVKNRNGAIFFIVTNEIYESLSALDLFIKERILFVHERVSGYYYVLTYFLSKITCDILSVRTIPTIIFSIIVYFMMGFQRSAEKFFIFCFGLWLTSICASSLCFSISATVKNSGNFVKII